MKKLFALVLVMLLLAGCAPKEETKSGPIVAATTAPVARFTEAIAAGTDLQVECVVTEAVSCLHDYTLSVQQMALLEQADTVIISGMGLEHFMEDILPEDAIDASGGVAEPIENDPHYWLDPVRAGEMALHICAELSARYPQFAETFGENNAKLQDRFLYLQVYAQEQLAGISAPGLVTFHDGFGYFADFVDVPILAAMEVEAGSEPAAKDLMDMIDLVKNSGLPAVFTEVNGSRSAADIIHRETGCNVFDLDMAMSNDYFIAMEHNIEAIREAFS